MSKDYIDRFLDAVINTPELDYILDHIEAPVSFTDSTYVVENTGTLAKTLKLLEDLTEEAAEDILETAVLVGLKMRIALEVYGWGLKGYTPS